MKKHTIRTAALALALAFTIPAVAPAADPLGSVIGAPSVQQLPYVAAGFGLELVLDASLPHDMNKNLRTFIQFVGPLVLSGVFEATQANSTGRPYDDGALMASLGASVIAYQFHF